MASKGQPECQPIVADPEPEVCQQKESVGDGTVDIDVELYELVDGSDSDIDMVLVLLICVDPQKGMGFGHLCHGSGLWLTVMFRNAGCDREQGHYERR